MYGREYDGKVLSFEPSGALMQGTLVMRDRETDSWWSIMTGRALGGTLEGSRLRELPVGEKVTWGEWRRRHPDTKVLSVDGVEHDPRNPYADYFESARTFRRIQAKDRRLPAKAPIFAFRLGETPYAVPFETLEGGAVLPVADGVVFAWRRRGAPLFEGTEAYLLRDRSPGDVTFADGSWHAEGATFDPERGWRREDGGVPDGIERLAGFDTFWYSWSNTNPHVVLLGARD